ncbi:MAG: tol-pal system protein YbgF [Desulfobulbaceae bacterium]|nr:tol-pal system protein YbgF [Desulfobulbaceae bacterium]
MKRFLRQRALLTTVCLSPFLVQCLATSQDFRNLDLRLRTMNNKMISMDRNVSDLQTETASRANKSSVDDLQKNQADSINTLDYLKTQLLQVKGEIEENTHQVQKLQEDAKFQREGQSDRFHGLNQGIEELRTTLEGLQTRLAALEKKSQTDSTTLQQLSSDMDKIREARASEAAERARKAADEAVRAAKSAEEARAAKASEGDTSDLTAEETRVLEPTLNKKINSEAESKASTEKNGKQGTSEKKPSPAEKKKSADEKKSGSEKPAQTGGDKGGDTAEPAQKLYDEGLANFNAKKFQKAYANFELYLEKYPKGNLAANARFWLGDSLYNQQEYELAILEYQKVIADYPQNGKSPAALLKQGMAFEQLKDNGTAKLVYLKLGADYKNSEESAVAQKRLEGLK